MKEDNILVQAALYAYPEYEREIMRCKTRAEYLTGLSYAMENVFEPLDMIDRVEKELKRVEDYNLLQNVVMTAVSNLEPIEKKIISLFYFQRCDVFNVIKNCEANRATIKYHRRQALEHVQNSMWFLGMDNAKMIELFDDSALLIKCASWVEKSRRKLQRAYGTKGEAM